MKKLIPAIGMTLLSAAMLGTSTFAWFSANTTVTATGIQMTAKSSSALMISQSSSEGWTNTISLVNENTDAEGSTFVPTEHKTVESAEKFYELTEEGMTRVNVDTGAFELTAADTQGSKTRADFQQESNDYFMDTFYLKVASENDQVVNWSATIKNTEATDDIYKAMHVALKFTNTEGVWDEIEFTAKDTKTSGASTVSLAANTAKQVIVYTWIEGQDTDCKNQNAVNNNQFTIDLKFELAE